MCLQYLPGGEHFVLESCVHLLNITYCTVQYHFSKKLFWHLWPKDCIMYYNFVRHTVCRIDYIEDYVKGQCHDILYPFQLVKKLYLATL